MMLATLFDYPLGGPAPADLLVRRRDRQCRSPDAPVHSEEERFAELQKMAAAMGALFDERAAQPPKFDLLSMLAHGEATRHMPISASSWATLSLLIVGGNDTTRNSMTGGVWGLTSIPANTRSCATIPR